MYVRSYTTLNRKSQFTVLKISCSKEDIHTIICIGVFYVRTQARFSHAGSQIFVRFLVTLIITCRPDLTVFSLVLIVVAGRLWRTYRY